MTLVMRLRTGVKKADPLASKFLFVTNNSRFADYARKYALDSKMIESRHCGPVIHRRDLAMIAWLRTGLDALESVPRGHLFASCERVLKVRMEVTDAVREKLAAIGPEKLEQYQLLLEEGRSVQRLMDQTLGDAKRVTADNAVELLEEMRRATAEEISREYEEKLLKSRAAHAATTKEMKSKLESADAEITGIQAHAAAALQEQARKIADLEREREREAAGRVTRVKGLIVSINRRLRQIDRGTLCFMWLVALGGILGILEHSTVSEVFGAIAGLVGTYHLIQDLRQKPKFGLAQLLDVLGIFLFRRRIALLGLKGYAESDGVVAAGGQILLKTSNVVQPSVVQVSDST